MSLDQPLTPSDRLLFVIRCDDCGEAATDSDGAEQQFASMPAALNSEALADWRTDRTGTPSLCPSCAAAADCDNYGHEYGDWYACRCNGQIGWHAAHGCPEFRYCIRCGLPDDPAYPDPMARREVA